MNNIALGKLLKAERIKKKLGKNKAAKEIGINVVTLVRIEKGMSFYPETARKIIMWLD